MHPGFARHAILLALAALTSACGSAEGTPRWVSLSTGFRPLFPSAQTNVFEGPEGRDWTVRPEGEHAWLEVELARADWTYQAGLRAWRTAVPFRVLGHPPDGRPPQELSTPGQSFRWYPITDLKQGVLPQPGSFLARSGRILLHLAEGAEPPERVTLALFRERGRVEEEADMRWRVKGHRFSGLGLSIWPGERYEVEVDPLPRSSLRFATCVEASPAGSGPPRPVRFRVLLEGQAFFEHEVDDVSVASHAWHELLLPPPGGTGLRLAFEVDGPFAFSSFLAPGIGPATGYAPEVRRPDVVLLQADTFRADNLVAYGGRPEIAPHLNALAEESLVFRQARSVSTHTLPAHATLLGGLFPREAGITGTARALPTQLATVAELFSRRGYRTLAITDSVLVSSTYEMDQGFEWFDEEHGTIESTVARVRSALDAGDGRPLFLFVQSYRAHSPYTVSSEARSALASILRPDDDYTALAARMLPYLRGHDGHSLKDPGVPAMIAELERLYRGSSADLDRGFGALIADLDRRGLRESGWLVLTSDHGEAFGEHDAIYHGGPVWEELLRVPLLIRGPGIEPGVIEIPASLIDLAPTLAWMGGFLPEPEWRGRSLLPEPAPRPLFAFQGGVDRLHSTLCVIEDGRKLTAFEDPEALARGELLAAFDLGTDPAEDDNLIGGQASWPGRLLERHRAALEAMLIPVHEARGASLDAEKLDELRDMGYTGE